MDRHDFFLAAACLLAAGSSIFYLHTIRKGLTKPSRSTYWIWLFIGFLILPSYMRSGGENWFLIVVNTFFCGLIAVSSLRRGEGGALSKWDKAAIGIGAVSMPVWFALSFVLPPDEAAFPMFFVEMIADVFATVVIFQKSWARPENEAVSAWLISLVSTGFNALAVRNWTGQDITINLWFAIAGIAITIILLVRPRSDAAVGTEIVSATTTDEDSAVALET